MHIDECRTQFPGSNKAGTHDKPDAISIFEGLKWMYQIDDGIPNPTPKLS